MLDVLSDDYVRTARSKGASQRRVVWRHALPNALIPVVTLSGVEFGYLLGGAVIVEQIFALPGLGRLVLDAITHRDYALVEGAVLFIAFNFLVVNLLVDLAYVGLDPRIRLGAR
jgi:peptide/nickel transport system permease protein